MNYANTLSSPRVWATERKSSASRDQILEARIETVDDKVGEYRSEKEKRTQIADPRIGPAATPLRYGAIDRAKFLRWLRRVGSIDSASVGSQANYSLDSVALGILSDGASKLAFHLFDSAASTISFSLPTQFSREEAEEKGAREVREKLPRLPSFLLSSTRMRSTLLYGHARSLARSLVRSRCLSTEVSFGSSREACGRWLVITLEEGAEVGRGKENLGNFRPTSLIVEVLMVPPSVYLKRIRC